MRKYLPFILGGAAAYLLWRKLAGKARPDVARQLVAEGATLLDVRSEAEYGRGHLPNARNIPVHQLGQRLEELGPREVPVVVYCASGMRSASAAALLRRSGFARVEDLGGMARWEG
jgi:phage shock protein E